MWKVSSMVAPVSGPTPASSRRRSASPACSIRLESAAVGSTRSWIPRSPATFADFSRYATE
jgi:hypothetical protein